MNLKYSLILFLLILGSCGKDNPECIDVILEDFKVTACEGGDLTKWYFNGRDVYCFFPGTCIADAQAEIYDEDCTLVCTLFGITGETTCEGLDWNSNAVFEELLYVR